MSDTIPEILAELLHKILNKLPWHSETDLNAAHADVESLAGREAPKPEAPEQAAPHPGVAEPHGEEPAAQSVLEESSNEEAKPTTTTPVGPPDQPAQTGPVPPVD